MHQTTFGETTECSVNLGGRLEALALQAFKNLVCAQRPARLLKGCQHPLLISGQLHAAPLSNVKLESEYPYMECYNVTLKGAPQKSREGVSGFRAVEGV